MVRHKMVSKCEDHCLPHRICPRWVALLLALFLLPLGGLSAELSVFAAASLTESLSEISRLYHETSRDKVFFNFAASSILARQIEQGAPADLFISADDEKMDQLERKKLLKTAGRKALLSNSLVVVVAEDSKLALKSAADLLSVKRVALAEPTTVPAGIYARKYLERMKLWDQLAPKVVPTENVRAALSSVQAGNVDAGIVYKTDAAISKKVRIALEIPADETPGIIYPAAVVADSREQAAAEKFLAYLQSVPARTIFEKHGFIVLK